MRVMTSLALALLMFPAPLSAQPTTQPRAYARFSPEHLDDVAWENDRIAFRVYGPALEKQQKTGSGIDVWAKRTRGLVIDRWYAADNYREDHGEGLDFYSVGTSRGCGGLGIWNGKSLDVSKVFATQRNLNEGASRAVFELTYEPWTIAGGRKVWESRRVTLDVGSNLNRMSSTIHSDDPSELTVGIGIAKRQGEGGEATLDKRRGLVSYWQPPESHGSIACAVLVDPAALVELRDADGHYLALIRVRPERAFTYYAGAGWSRSGDFGTPEEWLAYVRSFKANFNADK